MPGRIAPAMIGNSCVPRIQARRKSSWVPSLSVQRKERNDKSNLLDRHPVLRSSPAATRLAHRLDQAACERREPSRAHVSCANRSCSAYHPARTAPDSVCRSSRRAISTLLRIRPESQVGRRRPWMLSVSHRPAVGRYGAAARPRGRPETVRFRTARDAQAERPTAWRRRRRAAGWRRCQEWSTPRRA